MKKITVIALALLSTSTLVAQSNPAILSWLQNNSIYGSHYVSGNSTPIQDIVLANVQTVQYSTDCARFNNLVFGRKNPL